MPQEARNTRLQHEIDANLKRAYQEVMNEKVPDRFTQLLAQLKEAEQAGTSSDGGDDD